MKGNERRGLMRGQKLISPPIDLFSRSLILRILCDMVDYDHFLYIPIHVRIYFVLVLILAIFYIVL